MSGLDSRHPLPAPTHPQGANGATAALSLKRQPPPERDTEPFIGLGLSLRQEGHPGSCVRGDEPPNWLLAPPEIPSPSLCSHKKSLSGVRVPYPHPHVSCTPALQQGDKPAMTKGSAQDQTSLWQLQYREETK